MNICLLRETGHSEKKNEITTLINNIHSINKKKTSCSVKVTKSTYTKCSSIEKKKGTIIMSLNDHDRADNKAQKLHKAKNVKMEISFSNIEG